MSRPWEAERAISLDLALELIQEQFPEFSGAEAAPFGNGWDNTAVLVGDVVFRFPRRSSTVELLATEARALPRLAPLLPLPVPLPEWRGHPTKGFPWPFLGHRRLPGEPLSERPLPPGRSAEATRALGHFLAALHAQDAAALALPPDPVARLELEPRLPLLRERLAQLQAAGIVADTEPWLALFHGPLPRPRALAVPVHGDLYARHLLADEDGRLRGVIDWGDLHAGDPAADLMVVWGLLASADRPEFFAVYGRPDDQALHLARLRAAFHATATAAYAHTTGDHTLLAASRSAMEKVLQE